MGRRNNQRNRKKKGLGRVLLLSICLPWLLLILPWSLWLFMLVKGVHLGCSAIRLVILAFPFAMSEWVIRSLRLIVKNMWPPWMLRILQGYWPSVTPPAIVPDLAEHHVDSADLKSVGQYVDQYPATMPHATFQFQIPTKEGLNLWQGFIDVVLNAYEGNKSWAGTFTDENLRMRGTECRIEMDPSYPGNFQNLLLDLAQLAALLIAYFQIPNVMAAPRCIQQLHRAMTSPWLSAIPVPTAQQLEKFVKFMRHQPGLKPARKSSTFLAKVFQARRGMGVVEKATIDAAIAKVQVTKKWFDTIAALGYTILTRTVCYRKSNPFNNVPTYGGTAEEFFRFLRNVFEHGGDLDATGRQMLSDMEDLDYIAAQEFSDKIAEIVWHLVMDVDMTGLLKHAWADYQ